MILEAPAIDQQGLGTHIDAFGVRGYCSAKPKEVSWVYCRDLVEDHQYKYKLSWFFYIYNSTILPIPGHQATENISRWFNMVERNLGWTDKTEVHPTTQEHTSFINLSSQWMTHRAIISLATLMARIGLTLDSRQRIVP